MGGGRDGGLAMAEQPTLCPSSRPHHPAQHLQTGFSVTSTSRRVREMDLNPAGSLLQNGRRYQRRQTNSEASWLSSGAWGLAVPWLHRGIG
jgi:hypothetical protein